MIMACAVIAAISLLRVVEKLAAIVDGVNDFLLVCSSIDIALVINSLAGFDLIDGVVVGEE